MKPFAAALAALLASASALAAPRSLQEIVRAVPNFANFADCATTCQTRQARKENLMQVLLIDAGEAERYLDSAPPTCGDTASMLRRLVFNKPGRSVLASFQDDGPLAAEIQYASGAITNLNPAPKDKQKLSAVYKRLHDTMARRHGGQMNVAFGKDVWRLRDLLMNETRGMFVQVTLVSPKTSSLSGFGHIWVIETLPRPHTRQPLKGYVYQSYVADYSLPEWMADVRSRSDDIKAHLDGLHALTQAKDHATFTREFNRLFRRSALTPKPELPLPVTIAYAARAIDLQNAAANVAKLRTVCH